MKLAFIGEAAPAFKESGQVAVSQSNPGEFNLAMAAVMALHKTPLPEAAAVDNNNGTESRRGSFEPVSSTVIETGATASGKQVVLPQEPGQADYEETTDPVEGMYTPVADADLSKYLPAGQVQEPTKVVTADSEYQSQKPETSPVQPNIIGGPGESGMNSPLFTGILPLEEDYETIQKQVMPELTSPRANEFTNSRETDAPLAPAEPNQVPVSSQKSDAVEDPDSKPVSNQVAAFASANNPIPLFAQSDREPGVAPGQVYNSVSTAKETTGSENTTFARLEKPVVAQLGDTAVYEAALAVEDSPVFEVGSPAATTARAETAAAVPDQVSKAVLSDSPPVSGQVLTGQVPAVAPAVETSTSGEAVKSAGKEETVFTGKAETPAASAAVETKAAKTGGESGLGAVNNRQTAAGKMPGASVIRETDTPLVKAEQNQVPASGPKSGIVEESVSSPVFSQVEASGAAKGPVTISGPDLLKPAGTVKQTAAANVTESAPIFAETPEITVISSGLKASEAAKEPVISSGQDLFLFAQAAREPAVALDQVYNTVSTAKGTNGSENTTFTWLGKPVVAQLDRVVYEAALTVGDSPVFEAGSPAATTARAETAAAAPDQVLNTVPLGSSPATGQAVTGQAPAAGPAIETRTSGEAVKSAGKEETVFTGKSETPAASAAVETKAAKTGGESGLGALNNRQTAAGQMPGTSVIRETDTPLVKAEQNQVPASDAKNRTVGESVNSPVFSQVEASGAAKGPVTISGQDVLQSAGTVKQTAAADVTDSAPLFAQAAKEIVTASGVKTSGAAKATVTSSGQDVLQSVGTIKQNAAADVTDSVPLFAQGAKETVTASGVKASGAAKATVTPSVQDVLQSVGTVKQTAAVNVTDSAPIFAQAAKEIVTAPGVKASGAAKATVTSSGQDVFHSAGTLKQTAAVNVTDSAPLFAQAVREPAAALDQVYNSVAAAKETTGPENTTFTRLEKPVMAQLGDPAVYEAALAFGDSPVYEAGSPAATTARAETAAAATDQVLKAVLPGSPPAAGQVMTGQEPAATPAVETRTSGEAVKSAGKEETPAVSAAADTEAAITGGKGTGGAVENTTPNNASQYDSVSFMSNSVDNQRTVKLADMRDTLVQEIKRACFQQKSEPLTQVDLKLEPEHLGKLTIKLFFNGGELNAHFYAGNDHVKDVLEGSIQQLRQTLDQQDLKLNQAFVFVGDDGRSGAGQSESGGRQPARYSGAYGGHTYGDIAAEPAVYEPSGNSYKMVNYLI